MLLLLACKDPSPVDSGSTEVPIGPYTATVRWTGEGVPHIEGADVGSVSFGLGYAFARDHGCVLADQVVRVNSQRARWFGAGPDGVYLDEDFGWLGLGVRRQAEAGFPLLPAEAQAGIVGYAAGYNRWLEEHGSVAGGCAGAAWVQPLDHLDLLTYYLALAERASGLVFVDLVGTAAPPGKTTSMPAPPDRFLAARHPPISSNGWALGRDRVADGTALVLSNTHFPSEGELQWHESHLVVPGELNVYGISLLGVPVINIGFNEHVAWTHTVSDTPRFNVALLELDPADPLKYRFGDETRDIVSTSYTVQVLGDDGALTEQSRTLYASHWGPVLNAPAFGWTTLNAAALVDANANNLEVVSTWFAFNRATSLDDIEASHTEHGGVPWVHMMAADATGEVLYTDPASTPNWSAEAEARYPAWLEENAIAQLFHDYGAPTIDGSDPVFTWVDAGDARAPGLVPYRLAPQVRRTDYVLNANDNYWLPNAEGPLVGYPYLYGETRTPRSARTRMNHRLALDAGGEDGKFTLEELEAALLSGRGVLAEEVLAALVERCAGVTDVTIEDGPDAGTTVDVRPMCDALAGWGGTVRLDDPGAAAWREFVTSGVFAWEDSNDAGLLFAVPFDPDDPIVTPHTLATDDGPLLQALARGLATLQRGGVDPAATYREVQFLRKGELDFPVPGGTFYEGVIEIASYDAGGSGTLLPRAARGEVVNEFSGLTVEGYQMNYGNSWLGVMSLGPEGPRARALMVYSQSEDPASPHYADQSEAYAGEALRAVRYTEADIAADPALEVVELTYP